MSILRKRRKKKNLIKEIHDSKTKQSANPKTPKVNAKDKNDDYLGEYEADLRRFKRTVLLSTIMLFIFWWVPLLGPMTAGYLTGRYAGRKWVAVKAIAIPVLFIAVIVNLIQFGILPQIDIGRGIGSFFLAYFPGTYYAFAPTIIPVINVFNWFHAVIGIGSNGYLIIVVILAYLGGLVSEKKALTTAKVTRPKYSKSRSTDDDNDDDDNRFLYRKRNAAKDEFNDIVHKLKKYAQSDRSSAGYRTASIDFPISKEKDGWVRGTAPETRPEKNEDLAVTQSEDGSDLSSPKYLSRQTVRSDNPRPVHQRRTITGGSINGRGRSTSIYPNEASDIDGVDTVRTTTRPFKQPMSRAIVDRAVKSYQSDTQIRKVSTGEPECQMGHSYKQRNYESL